MELDYTYALDDSCQVKIHCRGHVDPDKFKGSCGRFYKENFDKEIDFNGLKVKHIYWRNVPAPSDCIVSDRQFVESTKGPGAFPVTILDKWLPL